MPTVNFHFSLVLAAADPSLWDMLRGVPKQTWINIAICVLAVVIVVRMWRALRQFNEFAPYIVALLAGFLICFYWIYERSEPRFLTPVVDKIAPFFPSKTTYTQGRPSR